MSNLLRSVFEVTFQPGGCAADLPTHFNFFPPWRLRSPWPGQVQPASTAGFTSPHWPFSPPGTQATAWEVTFLSVPVNENLSSASPLKPASCSLPGGVQTDETGAHPTAALGGCQCALGGPFNLASAALLPTSCSYASSTQARGSYWSSPVWQGPGLAQGALGLSSSHLSFPACCLSPCYPPVRGVRAS